MKKSRKTRLSLVLDEKVVSALSRLGFIKAVGYDRVLTMNARGRRYVASLLKDFARTSTADGRKAKRKEVGQTRND